MNPEKTYTLREIENAFKRTNNSTDDFITKFLIKLEREVLLTRKEPTPCS